MFAELAINLLASAVLVVGGYSVVTEATRFVVIPRSSLKIFGGP